MNKFLQLPEIRRRSAFLQVNEQIGLQALSVEKDFWVCWTLRELFTLPSISNHLTFKGGTSLSKAWQLIHRFSEDIDLVVDKELLGFGGDKAPDRATSNKQRKARLEKLKESSRIWVQQTLQPLLAAQLQATLGNSPWKLEVDPDMQDGQCLLFHYPSLFSSTTAGYVRPVVKIELGARSDDWPSETKSIQPYVTELFPQLDSEASFSVTVLSAERTFWEKACLLHEETFRPAEKPRKLRMARHYYDLYCLIQAGVATRALNDMDLFKRVASHREIFFQYSWVDYSSHKPGTFRLLPPSEHLATWRTDYQDMLGPMFFSDPPTFEALMNAVGDFEKSFNATVLS
ncbi:MAG: nucleotidyl transferase AbiEii/AbiGii toxin family protein [bacterium]